MRTPSPVAAIANPSCQVVQVGRAMTSVMTATTSPSVTRLRASHCISALRLARRSAKREGGRGRLLSTRRDPPVHSAHHLRDADVVDAPLGLLARPLVDARTLLYARDRDVVQPPRPVPLGTRRPEERDDRRVD